MFAFHLAFDGWFDLDLSRGAKFISKKLYESLGYDRKESVILHNEALFFDIINKKDLEEVNKNLLEHIRSRGKYPFHQEVEFLTNDGNLDLYSLGGKVIEWRGIIPVHFVGNCVNIADLRSEYKQSRAKLMEHVQDFKEFTSNKLLQMSC